MASCAIPISRQGWDGIDFELRFEVIVLRAGCAKNCDDGFRSFG